MEKNFDLESGGMLMALHINRAGLSQQSRMVAQEAATAHNANARRIATAIRKLDSDALATNTSIVNRARKFFDTYSIQWMSKGLRYVPVNVYPKVRSEFQKLSNEFEDSVSELVKNHAALEQEFIKSVGDISDEITFPTEQELRSGFRFGWTELPLPHPEDVVKINLPEKTLNQIQKSVEERNARIFKNAKVQIVETLRDLVGHLKGRLDSNGKLFKSVVENIEEGLEIAKSLNIDGDPEIERIITRIKNELASIDIEDLKKDDNVRMEKSNVAGSVLDDIKKSFGKL